MDLVWKLEKAIEQDKLFEPGDRIVVAVSGGPDSTALLQLLFLLSVRWGWRLTAAHANHGFRQEESVKEAAFIRQFAEERGIPFVYEELDVPAYLKLRGGNSQEAGRELRYKFLLRTAAEQEAGCIALAHHAGDQAETLLMRVIRGTGISGLAGIPIIRTEQNVKLVRPMLRINKNEILEDLGRHGIGYCTDSSNLSTKYTRNKLRLEAIPYLSHFNPSIVEALNRLAELASADDDYLEQEAVRAVERTAVSVEGGYRFGRLAFMDLHVALQRRFVKLILNYLSPGTDSQDFTAVERVRGSLEDTAKPNAELLVSGTIRLIREYDEIRLVQSTGDTEQVSYAYTLDGLAGELWIPEASCRLEFRVTGPGEAESGSLHTAVFDAEDLRFPLTVRNRRDGDRMRVDGLNGSKKAKDIFIDQKVPAALRERMPIITDAEGELLWIPGVRRSGFAKVTDTTQHVLCIRQFMS
jgi:tRNA(Ile)-lysidine synthase